MDQLAPRAVFLRDLVPGAVRANAGDLLINEGVAQAVRQVLPVNIDWCERGDFQTTHLPATTDMLVYAGMPQFGARSTLSDEEQAWTVLRERYSRSVPAFNIGCGTGYSSTDNRLRVAADMCSYAATRDFYVKENDVLFFPRDPISWHFLDMLGVVTYPALCPSGFAKVLPKAPAYELAIIVVSPNHKLSAVEQDALKFHFDKFISELVEAFPDALFIGQERSDKEMLEAFGARHIACPSSLEEFVDACSSARQVISFRVHGTVCGLNAGRQVLHFAIDGRSDLLSSYMVCGLWKQNLFGATLADHFSTIRAFLRAAPTTGSVDALVSKERDRVAESIRCRLAGEVPAPSTSTGCIVVDPATISMAAIGDEFVFTHRIFSHHAEKVNDRSIELPLKATGNHVVYGPYKRVAKGRYRIVFDFEFWGYLPDGQDAKLGFDVADGTDHLLADHIVSIRDLLVNRQHAQLEFLHEREAQSLEMRIRIINDIASFNLEFFGVRLKRIA